VLDRTRHSQAWRLTTIRLACCSLGRWLEKVGDAFDPERAPEADEVPINVAVPEQAASCATAPKL
jgi:hypothetical protein